MRTLLVTPSKEEDFMLIEALLDRINARFRVLSEEDKEDFGLLALMNEGDPNDLIQEDVIMEALHWPKNSKSPLSEASTRCIFMWTLGESNS